MKVTSDLRKLDKFVKTVNERWAVRVGIFSDRSDRKAEGNNASEDDNAAIGAKHELGDISGGVPIRSWLRMPLSVSQREIIREASHGMKELLVLGRMYDILRALGFACEDAILAAFKSGGFGTWKPLRPSTVRRKRSSAILIDTGQLRRAVASQVVRL